MYNIRQIQTDQLSQTHSEINNKSFGLKFKPGMALLQKRSNLTHFVGTDSWVNYSWIAGTSSQLHTWEEVNTHLSEGVLMMNRKVSLLTIWCFYYLIQLWFLLFTNYLF